MFGGQRARCLSFPSRAVIVQEQAAGREPGTVGYLTFEGDLDFCITIRTAVVKQGQAHIQSGAGVVADSDPRSELEETKAKAAALLPAVAPDAGTGARPRGGGDDASGGRRDAAGVPCRPLP